MNLKNSWKELRILVGWKYDKIVHIYLSSLLLMTVFSFLWYVVWLFIVPIFKDVFVTNEIAYSSIRIFASYCLIMVVLFLIVTRLSIRTVPENWRMVVDMAEEFLKEDFDKIPLDRNLPCTVDDVKTSMELAKTIHRGNGLYLLINTLKGLKQKERN